MATSYGPYLSSTLLGQHSHPYLSLIPLVLQMHTSLTSVLTQKDSNTHLTKKNSPSFTRPGQKEILYASLISLSLHHQPSKITQKSSINTWKARENSNKTTPKVPTNTQKKKRIRIQKLRGAGKQVTRKRAQQIINHKQWASIPFFFFFLFHSFNSSVLV